MFTEADLEATKTPEEVAGFIGQLAARAQELEGEYQGKTLDAPGQEEFAVIRDLKTKAEKRGAEFKARRELVESFAGAERNTEQAGVSLSRSMHAKSRIPENPHDISEYRARTSSQESMVALMVDGARKVAEQAVYPHDNATPDRTAAHIHKLLARTEDPGWLAHRILATGSPEYARAFAKLISGRADFLTQGERAALATVGSTQLADGGYAIPYTLDPTIILTSDGSVNPLRQISRVETLTGAGNTWKGVTSAGITVSRAAEEAAITATSPALAQPEVTVQSVKAEIQFSIEADQDWPRLQGEMARLFQEAKDDEEATSFVTGTGQTVNPEGIVAGLAATSHVGTTGDGFDLSDISTLINRLPDRFEPRARFLGHRAVYSKVEDLQAAQGNGDVYRALAAGAPATLRGYPRHNSSAMDSDFTTTGNEILLFGDFNNFLIVDKAGMSVELDPHVRNGDGKWTGQRALLAHWRNSSLILVDNAFRLMKVGVVTTGV